MNSNPYQYRPLNGPNTIRLVGIQPAVDPDQSLELSIFHACLDDSPRYGALSYEWNGERPWRLVDCNDSSSILVTPNCYAALARLRHKTRIQVLWVDAICIDQADVKERNSQVSKMIDIYQSADRTFVWLGNNDSGSDRALKFVRRASFFYRHPWLKRLLLYNGIQSWNKLGTACSSASLSSLASCPYWTRIWTVQEFCASVPIVFWGTTGRTSGTGALRAICEIFENHSIVQSAIQFRGRLHWNFQGFNKAGYEIPRLSGQYVLISRMCSTDDRDKVYALKGLFPTLKELQVDYDKPVWDVYAEATKLTVMSEDSLHLLQFVARSRDETRFPSWTVDWNYKLSNALTEGQTSKSASPVFQFTTDGRVLQLCGILVGEISENISRVFPQFDLRSAGFVFQGNPIDFRLCSRTCLKMLFDFYQEECKSRYPDFATYFRAVVKFLDPTNTYNAATQSIIDHIFKGHEHFAMSEIGENETPFLTKLNGTVLFMTTDGQFGIAQRDGIQQGDRIAVISGLGNPLILRPASNGFILISSTVISGLMDGELWPDDEKQISQLNII